MSEKFNKLVEAFKQALKKKEEKKFEKEDVKQIYSAAHELFDGSVQLEPAQIDQIRDLWVQLAEGKIDKSSAIKKLQGTSRAEAIQSVLLSSL